MGALAVLPNNKCGAHETFYDWSTPPYTAAFVVPSVSRAFLWAFRRRCFSRVSEGEIGQKLAQKSKGTLEKRLARRLNSPRAHGQLFIMMC
jgi:hypothetical protein